MKRILICCLAIAITSSALAQKHYEVVAIGLYNCENLFDLEDDPNKKDEDFTPQGAFRYTETVYRQKLHNVATVLSKMGTDVTPDGPAIMGLVEVENDVVLKELAKQPELQSRNYQPIWFPTSDERGISTAMLYNPKYFSVISARPINVPVESIGWSRPTRDILYVCGILAGDTVHVLVNHWPSKSGGDGSEAGRIVAARVDKKLTDSLLAVNPAAKILLMGDLNDNPTSDAVVKVLGARERKDDVSLNGIYNPWISLHKKGIGTECFRGEWALLDQIMLSGALVKNPNNKWVYYKGEVFDRNFLINKFGKDKGTPHRSFTAAQVWDNGYSDHFPVLVYLIKGID